MIKILKDYISRSYNWYKANHAKIIFVYIVHLVSYYLVNLPYINIVASLFLFLPYVIDWIAIMILFKPQKDLILKTGIGLFIISSIFVVVHISVALEFLGGMSYLMIGTYVVLSLRDIKD